MAVLRVKQADGTWAEIPALVGPKGDKGNDGKTPVKGTDYWTAADREQMVSEVLAALPDAAGVKY